MKQGKIKFYPFHDTDVTLEIKRYAKNLRDLDDFKHLKIFYVQYSDSSTFKKKLKLVNIYEQTKRKVLSGIFSFSNVTGSYNILSKQIMVFIDNHIKQGKYTTINVSKLSEEVLKNVNTIKKTCCNILVTLYHEKKHHKQKLELSNSFDSILYQLETNLKLSIYGLIKYQKQHNKWYFEIDANNYGVNKAIEYYKNNPQDEYYDMEYLYKYKKIYEYNQYTYDFDAFFTEYNIYKNKFGFISNIKNTLSNMILKNKNMEWHQVLYGNNNTLNSVEEIINNPLIDKIDPKFINYVLTSRYLNHTIDHSKLNSNTLDRLKMEFEKRYKETCKTIEILLSEYESQITNITKDDLDILKRDAKYCNKIISLLNANISINNKQNLV